MDWTERWIRALLMYIFYDRDRHLTVVAYLEFRGSAFIPILSFPPSNGLRWDGGDFIFDESACEAWNRRWRVTGQRCVAARKLGISMTRARLRRADLIVFFFFFFVSRPSRKSRTKIRPGTDRELNVRFSDTCRCANKRWSPVVPREAEAAVLHVVEFELITTISRGPSKLWGGRGGGRGIVHGIVNRYSVAITFT